MALQKTPPSPSPAQLMKPLPNAKPPASKKPAGAMSTPFWLGIGISLAWVGIVLAFIAKAGPSHTLAGVALADWAVGICAIASPVAMVWMVTAYLQRAADIQTIADPLRRQLTLITGESGAADARIRRFNQAIREQIELLRNAQSISRDDLEAIMDRVHQHRSDLERFESVSTQQVKEIQDVVRRSMLQVEQMMDDKFTMLRVLEGKLQKNGDGVARQVESVAEQITRMLEDVEAASTHMADALDRAQRDSQKLADTSRLQESSLTHAAEAAAETLGGLSSKIDLSVARFLERASTAREEAERLAHTLDAQTRSLDEFSTTLPVRVSEAESVLRGVADRLYASEQLAREQAINLSEKLSQQVDGLQSFMDRFTGRLSDIDTGLDRRHSDLSSLSERIGATTSDFLTSWEHSLSDLNDRTGNSLLRFTVVNDETRRNAESVAAHLNETTNKYEDVVLRLRSLSADSGAQMKTMTEEIARHLTQFEALSLASNKAGEEVQQRANNALQKLQYVLERLLAAREATQTVGETLVKDINDAVTQNEKMLHRLNETTQLSVRAMSAATESLSRQETALIDRARTGEGALIESVQKIQQQAEITGNSLRDQTATLKGLLTETQSQLMATDHKMKSFATEAVTPVQKAVEQIDVRAEQGLRTINAFGEGLNAQVVRLQDFHARIGGMSQDMSKATAESAGAFETLAERFAAVRAAQEEAARQTLAQFSDLSERLHREVSGLDGQASRAVDVLQQAALRVGEQSYQMLEKVQGAGAQVKDAAAVLQVEATEIQTVLRRQTEEIASDLARAEQKFVALGETIRARADAAYVLLDNTASYYGDISERLDQTGTKLQGVVADATQGVDQTALRFADMTETASKRLGVATEDLHSMTRRAESALATLGTNITQQAASLAVVGDQIGAQQSVFIAANEKQRAQMLDLFDKLGAAHTQAADIAERSITYLSNALQDINHQLGVVGDQAQATVGTVKIASLGFSEQALTLIQNAQTAEQQARNVLHVTSTLQEQAQRLREGLEAESTRASESLGVLLGRLTIGGAEVRELGTSTSAVLTSLQRALGDQTSQLNGSMQQISERQQQLTKALDQQSETIQNLLSRLIQTQDQAAVSADRTTTQLTEGALQIARHSETLDMRVQSALSNVQTATAGFAYESEMIGKQAEQAEAQARAVVTATSGLHGQIYDLRTSMQYDGERTTEVLGSLLTRITAGSSDMRDAGTVAEQALTVLQRALGEKTTAISQAVDQINDRQHALNETLEQQRETINALLNRYTLAQDETVALTERTAERLNEGAQRIAGNIDLIGAQASTTLVAVQDSVGGLTAQTALLKQHSHEAEQQVRGALSVTAGMQEQAQHLREAMQKETAQVVEQLATVIAQLDATSRHLKSESATAIQAFDQTAERFARTTEAGLGLVSQQTTALAETAEQAESRLNNVGEKIRGHLRLVEEVGDKTEAQAQQIANASEFATTRLVSLRDTLETNEKNSRDIVAVTSQRIEEVKTALQNQLQHLSEFSEQAVAQLVGATQTLATNSTGLRANLAASESALMENADLIYQEAQRLPATLNRSVGEIEAATRHLKDYANEADGALIGTADRFVAVTAATRDNMLGEMQRVSTVADEAGAVLSGFNQLLAEQIAMMQQSAAMLSSEQKDLVEKASRGVGSLSDASSRLSSLRNEATATAERLVREFDLLDQRAAVTGGRLAQAGEGIVKQVEAIGAATTRAENQIASVSGNLREQLERICSGLQNQIDDVNRGLTTITNQLERTGSSLRSTTVGAVADVERIGQRFEETNEAAAAQIEAINNKMRGATEDVAKVLGHFGNQFDAMLKNMAEAGNEFKQQKGDALNHLQDMLTHLGVVAEKLETTRALSGDISQHAIERLDDVVTAVQAQMSNMSASAQTAAGIMRGITQIYNDQSGALTKGVGEANNQVISMNKSIDEMQQRTDRMRGALKLQADDLMNSLRQILAQLEMTGDGLSDAVHRTLQQQAAGGKKVG